MFKEDQLVIRHLQGLNYNGQKMPAYWNLVLMCVNTEILEAMKVGLEMTLDRRRNEK